MCHPVPVHINDLCLIYFDGASFQSRQGNLGACFFLKSQDQTQNGHHTIYAARPGLRIWRANIEGKVSTTMIFKDSISKGEPEIATLNLPSSYKESVIQSEPKQFGPLKIFANDYLLSWQGSCIWLLEPNLGIVAGCHSNFGCIVDVATCNYEMFVLSKNDEQLVRRIVFENRPQSPVIEVKELSFKEEEVLPKIPRTGSVNLFEEKDKIDKIIGGVMNTTVGFISGVKRNVVKTIEHIKTRDESDDSTSSSEDQFPVDASSPIAIIRGRDVDGVTPFPDKDTLSTSMASPCIIKTPPKCDFRDTEAGCEPILDGLLPIVGEKSSENQAPNFQEAGVNENSFDSEVVWDAEKKSIEVTIKHDLREKETPFQHISKKDFNSDIVFAGTSKRKPRRKRKVENGKAHIFMLSICFQRFIPRRVSDETGFFTTKLCFCFSLQKLSHPSQNFFSSFYVLRWCAGIIYITVRESCCFQT